MSLMIFAKLFFCLKLDDTHNFFFLFAWSSFKLIEISTHRFYNFKKNGLDKVGSTTHVFAILTIHLVPGLSLITWTLIIRSVHWALRKYDNNSYNISRRLLCRREIVTPKAKKINVNTATVRHFTRTVDELDVSECVPHNNDTIIDKYLKL